MLISVPLPHLLASSLCCPHTYCTYFSFTSYCEQALACHCNLQQGDNKFKRGYILTVAMFLCHCEVIVCDSWRQRWTYHCFVLTKPAVKISSACHSITPMNLSRMSARFYRWRPCASNSVCAILSALTILHLTSLFIFILYSRQHLSNGDCLEDQRADYQNCSVLYCVRHLCTVIQTHMQWYRHICTVYSLANLGSLVFTTRPLAT